MSYAQDPATAQAAQWLTQLDRTLTESNLDAAVALFGDECYWRDLVAFTWNIVTLESQAEIRAMLTATLPAIQPSGWALTEPATEKDGIIEGWAGIDSLRDNICILPIDRTASEAGCGGYYHTAFRLDQCVNQSRSTDVG